MSELPPPPPKPKGSVGYWIVGSTLIGMAVVAFVIGIYNDDTAITLVGAVIALAGHRRAAERKPHRRAIVRRTLDGASNRVGSIRPTDPKLRPQGRPDGLLPICSQALPQTPDLPDTRPNRPRRHLPRALRTRR